MYSKANRILRLAFFIMKKIALISDTHGLIPEDVLPFLRDADEIWHAGDLGSVETLDQMESIKEFRAVYGNIDDHKVRLQCPLDLSFNCEGVKVFMTHIGGYPGRYNSRVRSLLDDQKPNLYICGHSHICKIVRDNKRGIIHMNPGACGYNGFHLMRTMILLECHESKISNVKIVELGLRSKLYK